MKRVRVAITFERIIQVRDDYTEHDVEFYLNDSCHCLLNELRDELEEQDAHEGVCTLCGRASGRVLDMNPPAEDTED